MIMRFVIGLSLSLTLLLSSPGGANQDAWGSEELYQSLNEMTLNETLALPLTFESIRNGSAEQREAFNRRFPGSLRAAELELASIAAAEKDKNWRELIRLVEAFPDRYPRWTLTQLEAAWFLCRLADNRSVPRDVRLSALQAAIPFARLTNRIIVSLDAPIAALGESDVDRYELARQLDEVSPTRTGSRSILWKYLEAARRNMPAAQYEEELQRLIQRAEQDTPESWAAQRALAQSHANRGDVQARSTLTHMTREQADAEALLKAGFARARELLETGDETNALAALRDLDRKVPHRFAEVRWPEFARDLQRLGLAARMSPESKYTLGEILLNNLLPGLETMQALNLLASCDHEPRFAQLVMSNLDKLLTDRRESHFIVTVSLLRTSIFSTDRDLRIALLQQLVPVMDRIGNIESKGNFLRDRFNLTWASQPELAASAIAELEKLPYPQANAVQSWLAAMTQGRISMVRPWTPYPPKWLETFPNEVAAPPLPALEAPQLTREFNGQITLVDFPGNKDFARGQSTWASSQQASAAMAVDGKPDTAWTPSELPASLTIQLEHAITPALIRIQMLEPSNLVVNLLDHQGRVVARFDREYGLFDPAARPLAATPVEIRPSANVSSSFVRIELHRTATVKAGISNVEVRATPVPGQGLHVLPAQALDKKNSAVLCRAQIDEPEQTIKLPTGYEGMQTVPFQRWERNPWYRGGPRLFDFTSNRDNVALTFFGSAIELDVTNFGALQWRVGDRAGESIHAPPKPLDVTTWKIAEGLPDARHQVWLRPKGQPPQNDKHTFDSLQIKEIRTTGRSKAALLVRFGDGASNWGPWLDPVKTDASRPVAMSNPSSGPRPSHVQAAIAFDSRSVGGMISATVREVQITPVAQVGEVAQPVARAHHVTEDLDRVAQLLAARQVVVAYSNVGTRAEYEAAKKLADTAGVYLAPDDLDAYSSLFPGLRLAVGTPLRNRVNRQLLAHAQLWEDTAYLNNDQGVVGLVLGMNGEPSLLFVTGETPSAVLKAAARLQAKISTYRHRGPPITLFASSTLEMIYPWQLRTTATPNLAVSLRLGQNDRRSTQLGLTAHQSLTQLSARAEPLSNERGDRLPVQVRFLNCYDYLQMFGALRIPRLLMAQARLPIPAHTSVGLWLTVQTDSKTAPGLYRGDLVIDAQGSMQRVPVSVRVEPLPLAASTPTRTHSFSGLPAGADHGGELPRNWERALIENEADHGLNILFLPALPVRATERLTLPYEVQTAPKSFPGPSPTTRPGTGNLPLKVAPRQSALVRFIQEIRPRHLLASGTFTAEDSITLEVRHGDTWIIAAAPTALERGNRGVHFTLGPDGQGSEFRITSQGDKPFELRSIGALIDPSRQVPFDADFSVWERFMTQADEIYAQRGLAPPMYLAHMAEPMLGALSEGVRWDRELAEVVARKTKDAGWFKRLIVKVGDEPAEIEPWLEMARPFREGGLRVMTCHRVYTNIDLASGVLEPWCPNYLHDVRNPFFVERRKKGDEFWWYACGYPTTRVSGLLVDNLPLYWLTAKWDMDGVMSFAAAFFNSENYAFRLDHGLDHRIAFLPDGTVVDTPHRVLEGEGICDIKLVEFIRDRLTSLEKSNPPQARELAQSLIDILARVVPFKYQYARDPTEWVRAREQLYDLALETQRQ